MAVPGGPTCARCGTPLRWVAEWNAWGCDRCRVSYPASPAAAPPQYAQPPPQAPQYAQPPYGQPPPGYAQPPPAPRASNKKWILIGAGVAVAVAVGVVLAVTLGGGGGGAATPQALIEAAIDRAEKGDLDGLVKLAGGDALFDTAIECKDPAQAAKMKDEMIKHAREDLNDRLDSWKGVTATVASVESKDEDPDVLKAGKDVEEGCTAKTDITSQRFRATIHYGDKDEDDVHFTAMQVSGRWYLESLPKGPGSGAGAGDKRKLEKMRDAMCACKDKACVDAVHKDYADFMKSLAEKYKGDAKPGEEEMKIAMEMAECEQKASSGSP